MVMPVTLGVSSKFSLRSPPFIFLFSSNLLLFLGYDVFVYHHQHYPVSINRIWLCLGYQFLSGYSTHSNTQGRTLCSQNIPEVQQKGQYLLVDNSSKKGEMRLLSKQQPIFEVSLMLQPSYIRHNTWRNQAPSVKYLLYASLPMFFHRHHDVIGTKGTILGTRKRGTRQKRTKTKDIFANIV